MLKFDPQAGNSRIARNVLKMIKIALKIIRRKYFPSQFIFLVKFCVCVCMSNSVIISLAKLLVPECSGRQMQLRGIPHPSRGLPEAGIRSPVPMAVSFQLAKTAEFMEMVEKLPLAASPQEYFISME